MTPDEAMEFLDQALHMSASHLARAQGFYMECDLSLDQLLERVSTVRNLIERARDLANFIEAEAVQKWGNPYEKKSHPVDNGAWTVKSGSKRKWDQDRLICRFMDSESPRDLHMALGANVPFKVTALKEMGIDPDDYSDWESGRKRLIFEEAPDGE